MGERELKPRWANSDAAEAWNTRALASRPAVAEGWVLVDVGCLECGEESAAVALFADQTEGEAAADRLNASDLTFTGGQHEFQLMSLPSAIAEPYAALLSAAPKP